MKNILNVEQLLINMCHVSLFVIFPSSQIRKLMEDGDNASDKHKELLKVSTICDMHNCYVCDCICVPRDSRHTYDT